MSLNTSSVIRRHMKRSSNFVLCDDTARLPVVVPLESGEGLVGWIRNPQPWEETVVVFTSLAMYVTEGGHVTRIGLREVIDYDTPKDKADATGVQVRTAYGDFFIRMAGRYGPESKYGDVFNLLMILQTLVTHNKAAE